ncbi:MAG: flagellar assembly protein FliX [Pseudomonadota bacterium]
MKIERTDKSPRTTGVGKAKRSSQVDGAAFARELEKESDVAAPGGASPIAAVNPLFALQEVEETPDAMEGRKGARARGSALLDELDNIRHELLIGAISPARLEALASLVESERPKLEDPKLIEVLDEIDLRVQVEIAKWSQER